MGCCRFLTRVDMVLMGPNLVDSSWPAMLPPLKKFPSMAATVPLSTAPCKSSDPLVNEVLLETGVLGLWSVSPMCVAIFENPLIPSTGFYIFNLCPYILDALKGVYTTNSLYYFLYYIPLNNEKIFGVSTYLFAATFVIIGYSWTNLSGVFCC